MNTGTIALSVTIAITAIVFYVLLKETSVFGKKYNDNYEMDVTKKLGYKVWTFMWIFTCLLSVIFNIVHGDWSGMDDLILLVGTTIIFVLLFSARTFIRKKTVSGEHYSCQSQSPKELFELLGVEIINRHEDNVYTIAYQGGYFRFHFMENTEWVDIIFFDFDSCNYEHIHQAQMVVNHVNVKYSGWTCYLTMSGDETEEKPLRASLSCRFALVGSLQQVKKLLQEVLSQSFYIVHDFRSKLEEDLKKKKDLDEQFFNDSAFNNKIAYLQRMKELNHLEERNEEFPESSELAIDRLIELFDHSNFGDLQSLKMVEGERVEWITDVEAIKSFNIREYIRSRQDATAIQSLLLVFAFERQELFVTLTKTKGSTENTLFFAVNVVRSGSELDALMDNRGPISSRTMLEIRMADSEKDYWEAKYMIDEANDKVNAGKSDELTDEQRLVLSYTNPVSQLALYWGKKYYNNRCYFQSLFYFNQIYWHLKNIKQEWNEEQSRLYYEICYYIGFIYADLNMHDKAFYYLYMAQSQHSIGATQEFANCLCNMNDPSAKQYLQSKINEVVEIMNNSAEEAERLYDFYLFLKRRYIYVLIEQGGYDEAESILKKMIENEECVEFAKNELDYIKKQRGEISKNEQTEKPKKLYS